jgi:HEAT repeat protein
MDDFADYELEQPEIDFQEVIEALLEPETPFPPRLLYGLSNLEGEKLGQFTETWPELTAERRESLLEDLELLSESNFVVSFEEVCKLGLFDTISRIRQVAIRSLWDAEEPEFLPIFLDIVENDPNLDVRAQAATGLGKYIYLGEMEEIPVDLHERVIEKLLEITAGSSPPLLKRSALEALGYSSHAQVAPLIEEAYNKDNDEWTISALIAMGRSANPAWSPMVIENINHSDNLVRLRAVQAAGDLASEKAVSHLIEHLIDPDDEVRMAAVWALSEIGGAEARDAIETILEETEDEDELDLIEDALENLEFTDMVENLSLFDLEEEDLEDMIHPEEGEEPDA